jgi:hypothetical protein
MILIDVSSSMGWVHPYGESHGILRDDDAHKVCRSQDSRNPSTSTSYTTSSSVRSITWRFETHTHHLAVEESVRPNFLALVNLVADIFSLGLETICFNSYGHKLGKINWNNFDSKWAKISDVRPILSSLLPPLSSRTNIRIIPQLVYRGGATQVMTGWQLIKETHFAKHGGEGKSWRDTTYGLQATKAMAKLSLLVLLDGEARDMDEFELDLLGEKWCYVTVCLIGKVRTPSFYLGVDIDEDAGERRKIVQIIIDMRTN